MAAVHGGYNENNSPYPSRRVITHSRNIRAVIFHPNGKYVFAAAPDQPKSPSVVTDSKEENRANASNRYVYYQNYSYHNFTICFNICRLYGFLFTTVFNENQSQNNPIRLQSLPTLLPEVSFQYVKNNNGV
jgi:hypothetical protein